MTFTCNYEFHSAELVFPNFYVSIARKYPQGSDRAKRLGVPRLVSELGYDVFTTKKKRGLFEKFARVE